MSNGTFTIKQGVELTDGDCRLLIEQVQAAVFVIQEGRFLFVNPKLWEMFGYSQQEMLDGMDPMLLCAPEYRDMVRAQASARVAGVPGKAYEIDCVRKDGTRFSAQGWGARIVLSSQAADLVTLHDVSAIKTATRYAQQRAQLFRNAEELARIGSAECDLVTGAVTLSPGMHAIFGVPPTDTPVKRDWLLARVPAVEVRGVAGGRCCPACGPPGTGGGGWCARPRCCRTSPCSAPPNSGWTSWPTRTKPPACPTATRRRKTRTSISAKPP